MTIYHPVGLENKLGTHRIIDARGQLIARTDMGPATAVEIRDALNLYSVRKTASTQSISRIAELETVINALLANDGFFGVFDATENRNAHDKAREVMKGGA